MTESMGLTIRWQEEVSSSGGHACQKSRLVSGGRENCLLANSGDSAWTFQLSCGNPFGDFRIQVTKLGRFSSLMEFPLATSVLRVHVSFK